MRGQFNRQSHITLHFSPPGIWRKKLVICKKIPDGTLATPPGLCYVVDVARGYDKHVSRRFHHVQAVDQEGYG